METITTAKDGKITEKLYKRSELQDGKMYVRISDIAYIYCGYDNDRRQFFKDAAGLFMEVETDCLFNNQYNTKTQRIYDSMVSEVVGDVRTQWCKNSYTGEMVKVGEETKVIEKETARAHKCEGCFWHQSKIKGKETTTEILNGAEIKTDKTTWIKECAFEKGANGEDCTHLVAANAKFDYFTPENTFFLKYPKGLKKQGEQILSIYKNCPKIGNYYLEYYPSLNYYRLTSARKRIDFNYKDGYFYVNNTIGNNQSKHLDVPEKIEKGVLKALANYPQTAIKDNF